MKQHDRRPASPPFTMNASELMRNQLAPIGAVMLAAGASRRMGAGGGHKLLAEFDGIPLIRRSAQTLLSSGMAPVVVVTGHWHPEMQAALAGLDVIIRFNPHHASGMGASLACGFADDVIRNLDGVLVMLADMPAITPDHLERLVHAFRRHGGNSVVRAACGTRTGNPVIIPKALYGAMQILSGDGGAKGMIGQSGLHVVDVDIGPAALLDVDTAEAVIRAGGVLKA